MKVVDQKDGHDLDPGGLKYRPRGEGGGGFGGRQQKDAVAVTEDLRVAWGPLAGARLEVEIQVKYVYM